MSEYQRYEFMTVDRPLTRAQLDEVNGLSSHIEASATRAYIEYHWGDFKHNPIKVLREYFDGFLYWANWGSPRLAFRFPHGALPINLINDFDFDDLVTFKLFPDYDILDIHFTEMEPPDEWTNYELGSLIGIREELLGGDMRALYIAWLAAQDRISGYDVVEDEDDDEEGEDEESDHSAEDDIRGPIVPPDFGKLTAAQSELASLLRVPEEMLVAAAQHSSSSEPVPQDNFVAWVELLPQASRSAYLVKLANNEPGLSRKLVQELRTLGRGKVNVVPTKGKRVAYSTLLIASERIEAELERQRLEEERQERERKLQYVRDHQAEYWRQIEQAAARGTGSGYEEAVRLLVELRDALQGADAHAFQTRFLAWVPAHSRRPALLKRLTGQRFVLPVM